MIKDEGPFELVFCDSNGKEIVKHGPISHRADADNLVKEAAPGTKSWKLYRVVREVVASGAVTPRPAGRLSPPLPHPQPRKPATL